MSLIFTIMLSGCVRQSEFSGIGGLTTTTATTTPTTAFVTTTTQSQLPSSKLLSWTKESEIRVAGGISSCTIYRDGKYWMYYTGGDISLVTSGDGINFVDYGSVIRPESADEMVTNPAVIQLSDGRWRMFYERSIHGDGGQSDRKIYSAVSNDGLSWTKESGIRFWDYGDGKPGEIFTSVPDVIRLADGRLRMYYTRGMASAVAVSSDEGLTWTKEQNLDLGEGRIAVDPDIIKLDDGTYKLFYTAFESQWSVGPQFMKSASSADGLNFVVDSGKRVEPANANGLVTDPDVVKLPGGGYRMYYGEFDSPENMQSSIKSAIPAS